MKSHVIDLTNTNFASNNEKTILIQKFKKIEPQLLTKQVIEELTIGITNIEIPSWYYNMVNNTLDKFRYDKSTNFDLTDSELKVVASFIISLIMSRCGRNSDLLINTEIHPNSIDCNISVYLSGEYGIAEHLKDIFMPYLTFMRKHVFYNFYIPNTISVSGSGSKLQLRSKIPNPMDSLLDYYNKDRYTDSPMIWDNTHLDIYPKWYGYDKYIDTESNDIRISEILNRLPNDYDLNTDYGPGDIPTSQIILPPKVNSYHAYQKLQSEISFRALLLSRDDPTRSMDENWHIAERRVKLEREYWSVEQKINEDHWKNRESTKKRSKLLHIMYPSTSAESNWYLAERQLKEEYMMTHESYFIRAMKLVGLTFSSGCCYGDIKDKEEFNGALSYLKTLSDNGNYMASIELAKYYYSNTYCMIEFGMSYKYFYLAMEQGYWPAKLAFNDFLEKNKDYSIDKY